jgi:hypothetical protein
MEDSPDPGILIDADSLITGKIDRLFESLDARDFVATQFCNQLIHSRAISRRLGIIKTKYAGKLDVHLVDEALSGPYCGLNVGVFGCRPGSPVVSDWYDWTMACRDTFIPDEMTLNLLQARWIPAGEMIVVDGRYNASPKDWKDPPNDVRIWHGHGNSFTKEGKAPRAAAMWRPHFERALEANLGGMKDWIEDCGNKHIPEAKYNGR